MNLNSLAVRLHDNRSWTTGQDGLKELLVLCAISCLVIFELYSFGLISFVNVYGAQDNATTTKFVTYSSPKYGVAIDYPGNWKIREGESEVWFEAPVAATGTMGIIIQSSQNMSLPELVQVQLDQIKETSKELNVISSNLTTLAGIPANRTDFTYKVEEGNLFGAVTYEYRVIEISALKGDTFYTILYPATLQNFHLFLPIVQKMLSTLKIL